MMTTPQQPGATGDQKPPGEKSLTISQQFNRMADLITAFRENADKDGDLDILVVFQVFDAAMRTMSPLESLFAFIVMMRNNKQFMQFLESRGYMKS